MVVFCRPRFFGRVGELLVVFLSPSFCHKLIHLEKIETRPSNNQHFLYDVLTLHLIFTLPFSTAISLETFRICNLLSTSSYSESCPTKSFLVMKTGLYTQCDGKTSSLCWTLGMIRYSVRTARGKKVNMDSSGTRVHFTFILFTAD